MLLPDDADLEASRESHLVSRAQRDLDAAAADVDDDGGFRRVHAVYGREMNQPCLVAASDDARADARRPLDFGEKLAPVFRLACGARRRSEDLVHLMRFRESFEFREGLERAAHGAVRQPLAVESACPEPDHLFFAVDDLERKIRPNPDDDHVDGVGADIDRCKSHRRYSV